MKRCDMTYTTYVLHKMTNRTNKSYSIILLNARRAKITIQQNVSDILPRSLTLGLLTLGCAGCEALVNERQNTTPCNRGAYEDIKLLVATNRQLQMPWRYTFHTKIF